LKEFNLISKPVLIPRERKQENGTNDVIHLSEHLNATLKFGQLKKTSPLRINVSDLHLTVRRKRIQDALQRCQKGDPSGRSAAVEAA